MNILQLDTCKSTNMVARDYLEGSLFSNKHPDVIVARKQTQGKGRSGTWFSPEDNGIYMSVIRPGSWTKSPGWNEVLRYQVEGTDSLTKLFGMHIKELLADYFQLRLDLFGVNDIYLAGKKLAGILIEHHATSDKLIVGVGLNTFRPVKIRKDLINKAVWLNDYAAEYLIEHKKLVSMIAEEIMKI